MTDKQQLDAGKVIKFGVNSLSEPTPKFMKMIFRAVSFIVGIWALVQHMNLGLPEHSIKVANEWAIAVVPLMHFTIKFFRWDYSTEEQ